MKILLALISIFLLVGSASASTEQFEFGDFAIYIPANVSSVRGILLALGGPDTRAFFTDGTFGAPVPELESSLHVLGQELRKLAADQGLAILGTSHAMIPNERATDELILKIINEASVKSGRNELANAPLLIYGISGGTPEAIGFTVRNPKRVGALLLKGTAIPEQLKTSEALSIPTYILLLEQDTFADNKAVIAAFKANRKAGALWALAVEPGVPHHSLTPAHRAIVINWLREMTKLRLGKSPDDSLPEVAESSGWLGDSSIGVAKYANFRGDRRSASWFPSKATAEEWKMFVARKR
jgi:dienelactone hydrolase